MELTRHFTVTTYIVFHDRVLLHMHPRLDFWLPVGGHIDRDELPHEAALREAFEESGLRIRLFSPNSLQVFDQGQVRELLSPARMMVQNIQDGHEHIDFAFYATTDTDQIVPEAGKTTQESYRWCSLSDLATMDLRGNVKFCAEEALNFLGAK